MTSLFLVTSAIYTSYGKCSTEERIEQTKETIKSIRTYAPDSTIVLLDAGDKSVNIDFGVELIDYTQKEIIRKPLDYYLQNNKDIEPDIIIIKSMLEIIMFEDYLKNNFVQNYSRVFKLSGRYRLNSKFNYSKHLEAKNKVVILPPDPSQHLYNIKVSSSMFQYMTRCWSFDISLILNIIETYGKMKKDIIVASRTEKQGDIEHLLYKHLDKRLVENIGLMGIEGYWAPLKIWIEE
jgi:hypothetical protein